jgi:DNA modification methylase
VSNQYTCRIKSYIQPFERKLALAELEALTGQIPEPRVDEGNALDYIVSTDLHATELAQKLAYWESVRDTHTILTTQALREATINVVRNGVAVEQIEWLVTLNTSSSLPNRRALRYGPHGIHEYRGKFFPQLVRSLINIAQVPKGGIVADPMSGSGTTAVEAVLSQCHGMGLDMNPLSVLMGRTKAALLSIDPSEIIGAYIAVRDQLMIPSAKRSLEYFESLSPEDQEYLRGWFSEQVLFDLDRIVMVISSLNIPATVRDMMRLSLSNIIRSVSWQKSDDLRVRKEVRLEEDIDPINEFLEELNRSVKAISSMLYYNRDTPIGTFHIQDGDARAIPNFWKDWLGKVDTVITSPPYATALPYLDTDRLSLLYLGLLSRRGQRERDQEMIGNREVTDKKRKEYWQYFLEHQDALPASVVNLIDRIERLNSTKDVGFRRKNLPALLAKYFLDMKEVLFGISQVLKPGAPAFIVVGDNHTTAGEEKVDITTSSLLIDVAEMVGLEALEHIPMEMLISRDIFRKNAMSSEIILCFRRPVG